jgi:Flp pilus assembly protein TadD
MPKKPAGASLRTWRNRALAAVGVPLALLLCLEGALRLAGVGRPVSFLIRDDQPGALRTNPDFASGYLPGSFDLRPLNFRVPEKKPPDAVRIVVLGESAAQGIPAPAFAFAPQLRAQLRARYPGREFEVIDTGIVAINSHVVYQIARQMASLSPDLFVVYMGNNEVVGPYGPGCAYLSEMPPLWVIRLSEFVKSTRTGQLMGSLIGRLAAGGRRPAEWGGMAMFADSAVRGDDPRLEAVYRNFESNLGDIVAAAHAAGAKTILCTVACNVKDCAPFLSLHRADLAPAQLEEWEKHFKRGRIEWLIGKGDYARRDLAAAEEIDPQYADVAFLLGRLELEAGDVAAARRHLAEAEHWDALRFRPDPRINAIIRRVAGEGTPGVSLVDVAMELGSDPDSGAPPAGSGLLFEHVHFDWDGNFRVARAMAQAAALALLPGEEGRRPWLDSTGCAAALAYTPHERLSVLRRVGAIVDNPPFTNQLTYALDEALLAREVGHAKAVHDDPAATAQAAHAARAAAAADPESADLAKIEEDADDDAGNLAGALADAQRAAQLQPRSFALGTDQAIKLSRLGRYDDAEALLKATAAASPPRDRVAMAPAYADLFTRTRRFDEGRRYLDAQISGHPSDAGLRILRGRLAALSGDAASAEADFRGVLASDPSSQRALEELVALLGGAHRGADAEKASLDFLDRQPRNLANNLRCAILYDSRSDAANAVRCLLAAEDSGPVTAAVELQLSKKLFALGRLDETLSHLALAARMARIEDAPETAAQVEQAIDGIWSRMH